MKVTVSQQYEVEHRPERAGCQWAVVKPYVPDEHIGNPLRAKPEVVCFYATKKEAESAAESLRTVDISPETIPDNVLQGGFGQSSR
jgi:hypothetical protein